MEDDQNGLMIIRAWIEPGSSEPLRAQVRLSTNVSAGIERTVTLCRGAEVCATVEAWLGDIMSNAESEAPNDSVSLGGLAAPGGSDRT